MLAPLYHNFIATSSQPCRNDFSLRFYYSEFERTDIYIIPYLDTHLHNRCRIVCSILSELEECKLKNAENCSTIKTNRAGLKDVWNAFMLDGAEFTSNDIPICPTTAELPPSDIITWDEAKAIYKKHRIKKDLDFKHDAFVCWYMDDYKFDSPRGIWRDYNFALKVLRHFAGVITPDFSTYQDFPEPIKLYNTYRMRAFGYWLGKNSIAVINNVRWGTSETYRYCFDGIEQNSVVAIGTVGGSPRKYEDRARFTDGLNELVKVLQPHTIIVYGSANYPCFEELKNQGINIVPFSGQMAKAFERRKIDE